MMRHEMTVRNDMVMRCGMKMRHDMIMRHNIQAKVLQAVASMLHVFSDQTGTCGIDIVHDSSTACCSSAFSRIASSEMTPTRSTHPSAATVEGACKIRVLVGLYLLVGYRCNRVAH